MDSKAVQFVALTVFLVACLLAGVLGFIWTSRLVAFRMQKLKERRLEKYVPFLAGLLRLTCLLLAVLSVYVLTKMPLVYQCAFGSRN